MAEASRTVIVSSLGWRLSVDLIEASIFWLGLGEALDDGRLLDRSRDDPGRSVPPILRLFGLYIKGDVDMFVF